MLDKANHYNFISNHIRQIENLFKENFEGFESEFEDSDFLKEDEVCQWWVDPNCKPLYDPDPNHVLEGIMP